MEVVILCGGKGLRIKEAGEVNPKPMLEIGGKPILWHIMKMYASRGHNDFVLALGHRGAIIKKFFLDYRFISSDFTLNLGNGSTLMHSDVGEDWNVTCIDTGEDKMTAARIKRVSKNILGKTFMLTYGDGVADIDINKLIEFHKSHGKLATISGVRPSGRFGEITCNDGLITHFNEKPQTASGYINGGFMVMEKEAIDRYFSDDEGEALETGPLSRMTNDGQLMMFAHHGFWHPMDTLREYQYLNNLWGAKQAPWKIWEN